ncbi:hypothetical protein Barb4_04579 [Bacteroidales bacterium Barb4]|nr:hypothetical protein Barb4_04579 [Bacteroidales bacterium Barb4]
MWGLRNGINVGVLKERPISAHMQRSGMWGLRNGINMGVLKERPISAPHAANAEYGVYGMVSTWEF